MAESYFLNGLKKIESIICIAEFGSYRIEYWNKDRSDIDLAVVVKSKVSS
ncbi:nucleotidyltransferase domain-containing protein [Clostridium beijerinckii]|nr:nucleotidyltransferase domain-containing protein [Clostridium beijerinckii]